MSIHRSSRKAKRKNPEQILHKAVADYLRVALVPPAFFTTFPSGGGGRVRGAVLKSMGLCPGMPDLLVFWVVLNSPRLAGIELKAAQGRLSPAQRQAHDALAKVGVPVLTCKSIDEVATFLSFWGVPHRARVGGAA